MWVESCGQSDLESLKGYVTAGSGSTDARFLRRLPGKPPGNPGNSAKIVLIRQTVPGERCAPVSWDHKPRQLRFQAQTGLRARNYP